jgi:hypothetical protein
MEEPMRQTSSAIGFANRVGALHNRNAMIPDRLQHLYLSWSELVAEDFSAKQNRIVCVSLVWGIGHANLPIQSSL